MDIIDIGIAKRLSLGSAGNIMDQANEALTIANQASEMANNASTRANNAANTYDNLLNNIDNSISNQINQHSISQVSLFNNDTLESKSQNLQITKNNSNTDYIINKNYTSLGSNEDGGMTQKAITDAINSIEIPEGRQPSFDKENEGSIVSVDSEGNINLSIISEAELILTQIAAGTYYNKNVVGVEFDYVNNIFTRIQGARGLNAGEDFDKFDMYGGRKRCVVKQNGEIVRFISSLDSDSSIEDQRIMVYQPAFYYLRFPKEVVETENGTKILKEQLLLSDKKIAGFNLHPAFKDSNGNSLKYILIPAFESSAYRVATNIFEKEDRQDIDLDNDMLVSIIEAKPISGSNQNFNAKTAEKMAQNNGEGWHISNLEFESMNQMLMMVEFNSPNMQSSFNQGITNLKVDSNLNISCNTGATFSLRNNSGQALETIGIQNNNIEIYSEEGKCAISYRGMENPYGSMWKFIRNSSVLNKKFIINNTELKFKIPLTSDWINAFGYDKDFDWVFFPIEAGENANSSFPIGDYVYVPKTSSTSEYGVLIGGYSASALNAGIFYYAFDTVKEAFNYKHDSARIINTPIAGSTIETKNYNLWNN